MTRAVRAALPIGLCLAVLAAAVLAAGVHPAADLPVPASLGAWVTGAGGAPPELPPRGERFMRFVPPPEFTRSLGAQTEPRLQPGDGGDQGAVVLERRHTDHAYLDLPLTGGLRVEAVMGDPQNYLCLCDAVFVMVNHSGADPTRPIRVTGSAYVWVDNLTVYGGAIVFENSRDIIVSDSLFIDSAGILAFDSFDGLVHDISVVQQRPPTNLLHHPPDPLGSGFLCFPHQAVPCAGGGVLLHGGARWTIEWSYFHGAGGAGSETYTRDITIRHNTFRDTIPFWAAGTNEIGWNLIRGNHGVGPMASAGERTEFHNNSILIPFKISLQAGIQSAPGLSLDACGACTVRHNDFLGYGVTDPALCVGGKSHVVADDNYWGTLHDPRLPAGQWICSGQDTTLILDRWEIRAIHNITPLMYTLDARDVPYWLESLAGDAPLPDAPGQPPIGFPALPP